MDGGTKHSHGRDAGNTLTPGSDNQFTEHNDPIIVDDIRGISGGDDGRPKFIDPKQLGTPETGTDQPRRRGRPAKSGGSTATGTKTTARKVSLERVVKNAVHIAHTILYNNFARRSLYMSEQEAATIGSAVGEVLGTHGMRVDPKIEAWINLGTVLSASYGTRLFGEKFFGLAPEAPPPPALPMPQPGFGAIVNILRGVQ